MQSIKNFCVKEELSELKDVLNDLCIDFDFDEENINLRGNFSEKLNDHLVNLFSTRDKIFKSDNLLSESDYCADLAGTYQMIYIIEKILRNTNFL